MHTRGFGRNLKLPSTVAIQHAILKLMIQDELKTRAPVAPDEILVAHGRGDAETLNSNRGSVLKRFSGVISGRKLITRWRLS